MTLLCFAIGVLDCLEHLQKSAPLGSKVVRTLGNHDLLWLEGQFDYKHKADTPIVLSTAVRQMKLAIANGFLLGSFMHWINGLPLVFVHAGFRPAMLSLIDKDIRMTSSSLRSGGDGNSGGSDSSSSSSTAVSSLSGELLNH